MAISQRMWLREQERKRRERLKRARRRRNCAIAVFVAAIVAVVVIVSKSCDDSSTPLSDAMDTRTVSPVAEEQTPVPDTPFKASADISELDLSSFDNSVFVGNAVAETIDMYNLLPETDFYTSVTLDLENVYTTASNNDSMSVADQLKSTKFSRVYLCFGERELDWNNASKFGVEYREFIAKVKEYQPSASIYVISIPPITKSASESNLYGADMDTIKEYNRRIRNMAYSESLYYVDSIAALGRNGGYLNEGTSADGMNINKEYAVELISYIKNKAYIPNTPAAEIENEENDEQEKTENTPTPTPVPVSTTKPEPEPTINVLKDSAIADENKN